MHVVQAMKIYRLGFHREWNSILQASTNKYDKSLVLGMHAGQSFQSNDHQCQLYDVNVVFRVLEMDHQVVL